MSSSYSIIPLASVAIACILILQHLHCSNALIISTSNQKLLGCSNVCESEFCEVAPLMRYGKYCGLGYTGCPSQPPCDGLDACCKAHDDCIGSLFGNYLNTTCNRNLLNCVIAFRASRARPFHGNTCNIQDVEYNIETAMKIALHL